MLAREQNVIAFFLPDAPLEIMKVFDEVMFLVGVRGGEGRGRGKAVKATNRRLVIFHCQLYNMYVQQETHS